MNSSYQSKSVVEGYRTTTRTCTCYEEKIFRGKGELLVQYFFVCLENSVTENDKYTPAGHSGDQRSLTRAFSPSQRLVHLGDRYEKKSKAIGTDFSVEKKIM